MKSTKEQTEIKNNNLIERAKAGDSVALSKLCEANQEFVFKIMLMKTRSRELAQDLTQDTLIKMMTNVHQYVKTEKNFRGWLSTIITSVFIDHTRKEKNRLEKYSSDISAEMSDSAMNDEHMDTDLEYNVLSHTSVEQDYIKTEQNEMMKKIITSSIESLSNASQKRAIVLSLFQELSYNEISEQLNVSVNNTKALLFRAKMGILKNIVENNYHLAGRILNQRILKDHILENMSHESIAKQYKITVEEVEKILEKSMSKVYKETFFGNEVPIM